MPTVVPLLPVARTRPRHAGPAVEYIFEPPRPELLGALLPLYVADAICGAARSRSASEHGARMTAMDNATTNANDMIDRLTLR